MYNYISIQASFFGRKSEGGGGRQNIGEHGIFSGEGLDLNFPLGGGAIFQPREGPGEGPKVQDFFCANVDIYNDIGIN